VQCLRPVLAQAGALHLAILFGSHARGAARQDSDVDIAILPIDPKLPLHDELSLQAGLSAACGLEVDLVRIDTDDVLLRWEIAKDGILLFEDRPGTGARFRAEAGIAWDEQRPLFESARRRFLARVGRG
jgi:predicted nucleotidyltransferase